MNSNHTAGFLLKRLRTSFNLTQKQFGDSLGLSQGHVSAIEQNRKQLTQDLIKRIAAVFSLSDQQQAQLLTASGYQDISERPLLSPALSKLYHFFEDAEVAEALKALLEEQLSTLHGTWITIAQTHSTLSKRQWTTVLTDTASALRSSRQLTALLPIYLKELQVASLIHQGNTSEAERLLVENEQQMPVIISAEVKAMHHIHWGDLLRDLGQWSRAEQHYFEAKSLYEHHGYTVKARQVDRKIAVIHLFRGDWNAARPILESCQSTFTRENLYNDLIRLKYALAWVHNLSGDWEKALKYHQEGLALAYAHANASLSIRYLVMLGHSYLGNDYRQTRETEKALAEYERANELAKEFPQDREFGWILIGLARVAAMKSDEYVVKGNKALADAEYQRASSYFEQALAAHRKSNFAYRLVMTQVHYARFLLQDERTVEKAEQLLTDALTLANSIHSVYYAAQIKSVLCELYRKQRRFELIAHYVQEVEELAGQYHFYRILARLKATLAGAAVDQGYLSDAPALFSEAFHYAILFNSETKEEILGIFIKHLMNLIDPKKQHNNINLFGREDAQVLCKNTASCLEKEFYKPKFFDSSRKDEASKLVQQVFSYAEDIKNRVPLRV